MKAVDSDGAFWAVKVERRQNAGIEFVRTLMEWVLSLRHANVVHTADFAMKRTPQHTMLCSVMEMGTPFFPFLTQRELPLTTKYNLFEGVAAGIAYLHDEHGFVHADLDVCNVIIVGSTPKVMDFGTLQKVGTDVGGRQGKMETAPPEKAKVWWQSTGVPSTFAWDVYALGLLGHCVFTKSAWPDVRGNLFNQTKKQVEELRGNPKFLEDQCGGDPALLEVKLAEWRLREVIKTLADSANCPGQAPGPPQVFAACPVRSR
eukprot:TRINITY_DN3365_c0_g1_i2.p1 TRINITY_DN3365_c0_g1~~TRINITY_DN3365_c0_g1_i2.p1  ORF type:complete len:260 (+),score=61.47 TRINITY_DN3365_c0_g1_i2:805-1584(+)